MNKGLKKFPFFLPFAGCRGQCVYCNQKAITGVVELPQPDYVRSVLSKLTEPREVCYFGGSFCRFSVQKIIEYLDAVVECAPTGSTIRFSTYPGDLSDNTLRDIIKKYPIARVELGIPTLDRRVLSACRREADPEKIINDIKILMEDNLPIGVQMMIGLPFQDRASVMSGLETLAKVKKNDSWDLRLYPCLVIQGTELEQMYRNGTYIPMSTAQAVELGGEFIARAVELGFVPIRVGLQETESLADECIAGPHEPALGEMIFADAEARRLARLMPPWKVPKRDISKFTGHGKLGIRRLAIYCGLSVEEVQNNLKFI